MKRAVLLFALALAVLLVGSTSEPASGKTENLMVVSSFDFPVAVKDLAWDGEHLWAATGVAIYKLDTSGNIISSWNLYHSDIYPVGVTWDGDFLWIVDEVMNYDYKISELGTNGKVLFSFVPDVGRGPVGIAWDGKHLWVASTWGGDIYELNPVSGEVISWFDRPGCWGIAWDGNYLWVSSPSDERIYKLDVNGNVISSFDSPGLVPLGMALDGKHLWVSDEHEKKIYQLQVVSYYELHTSVEPQQGGSVNISPSAESYAEGTQVTLTAVPAENYEFDRWWGNIPSGVKNDSSFTMIMDSDKSVTASFETSEVSGEGLPVAWVGVGVVIVGVIIGILAFRRFG